MPYLICAVVSVFLFVYLETNQFKCVSSCTPAVVKKNALYFIYVILLFYWSLLLGLQYQVGTDYNAYLRIFSEEKVAGFYRLSNEYLFYYIAIFLINNRIFPQAGFIIVAFIQSLCFLIFLHKLKLSYNFVFIFLYFFVCTSFYNQTNALRQFAAANIFLLSVYCAYKKRIVLYVLLVVCAALFHAASWFLLPFYFIFRVKYNKKILMLFLCVSLLLSFIGIENIIERAFDLLGIKLYVRYFTSSFSNTEFALAQKMTKYIYVPFYLLSLNLYNGLNKDEKFFFNAGFLSFCFKIISLSSFIVGRFVYFFEVLTIIPLYYLLCWLMARKNKDKSINMFFIAMLLCAGIGLLTLKVIVANDGEYHYQSIFSLYFQS